MEKLDIAIVENEEEPAKVTASFIEKYSAQYHKEFKVTRFENGFDFLENKEQGFDIVFMDIDMPGINGMETSMKLREKYKDTLIIFVTNLPQYAIDGYKVNALDFILKPMTYEDFTLAMNRAVQAKEGNKGSFVIEYHGGLRKYQTDDVLYIEVVKHDIVIHGTDGDKISLRGSMKAMEEMVNLDYFFRCNSGYLINLNHVLSLQADTVTMKNNIVLEVSRSHRKELLAKLTKLYSEERIHSSL